MSASQLTRNPVSNQKVPAKRESCPARSLAIAQRGIVTEMDFAQCMSALMSDLLEGSVTSDVGNAVVNAGGKLLKVVEMRYKYGTKTALILAPKPVDLPE